MDGMVQKLARPVMGRGRRGIRYSNFIVGGGGPRCHHFRMLLGDCHVHPGLRIIVLGFHELETELYRC